MDRRDYPQHIQEEFDGLDEAYELGEMDARANLEADPERHDLHGRDVREYHRGFDTEVAWLVKCSEAEAANASPADVARAAAHLMNTPLAKYLVPEDEDEDGPSRVQRFVRLSRPKE